MFRAKITQWVFVLMSVHIDSSIEGGTLGGPLLACSTEKPKRAIISFSVKKMSMP